MRCSVSASASPGAASKASPCRSIRSGCAVRRHGKRKARWCGCTSAWRIRPISSPISRVASPPSTRRPGEDSGGMSTSQAEITIRGVLLGVAMTFIFTAANVYLGLRVGMTFATSIPAAVISMALLRLFRNATIYENNIVQTVASAAGTLSSIIFVLPGLVMIGWWTHFPYWQSVLICVLGGILGVTYSVPLRRALVTQSSLPYPEGVAAAEVLKVGAGTPGATPAAIEENKHGLIALTLSSIVSAAYALVVAMGIFVDTVAGYFRAAASATGFGVGMSLALIGAGYLIGIQVGLAILAGLVIAWGILTPLLTALHPTAGAAADVALNVWQHQVRFIGAGTIGAAALWTLGRLAKPVYGGIASALAASRQAARSGE